MKVIPAVCSAIACAATAAAPNQPMAMAAALNTPISSSMLPLIGRPSRTTSASLPRSGRQKRPSRRNRPSTRSRAISPSSPASIAALASALAMPAPRMPSPGQPKPPKTSSQHSTPFSRIAGAGDPERRRRPLHRREEAAQHDEAAEAGRPHIIARR